MKIFVAGATGAVGLPLVRALCTLGHQVVGMTRAGPGVDRLRELGASAATADAFDRQALRDAIAAAAPDVVIDQLTWLPANPADIIKPMPNDTRLHEEGGGNLFPALAQRREGGSREEDRRDKIDVDHGPELRFRDVFQTAGPDAAGVVDEDVKAAEGGKCLFERRGAAFGRRDIGYNAVDFGAPGLQGSNGSTTPVEIRKFAQLASMYEWQ